MTSRTQHKIHIFPLRSYLLSSLLEQTLQTLQTFQFQLHSAPRAKRGGPNKFFLSGFNKSHFYIHQKIKKKTLFEIAHISGQKQLSKGGLDVQNIYHRLYALKLGSRCLFGSPNVYPCFLTFLSPRNWGLNISSG